jgi:hypothetical protein
MFHKCNLGLCIRTPKPDDLESNPGPEVQCSKTKLLNVFVPHLPPRMAGKLNKAKKKPSEECSEL